MKSWRVPARQLLLEELEGRLVPSVTTSSNWSGYAVTANSGAVTFVSGSWVVPTFPAGAANGYEASWVGIDGYNSPTVEQVGTEADYSGGQATYYAWYEMYPAASYTLPLTIHAGDTISASVTYSPPDLFTLSLTDVTIGQSATVTTSGSAARTSAEWVVEAPSGSQGILPLDGFGTEPFTAAKATVNGTTGPIDGIAGTQVEQINMIDRGRTDSTSGLTDSAGGSAFTVTSTGSPRSSGSASGSGRHHGGAGGSGPEQPATPASALALAAGSSASTSHLLAPVGIGTTTSPAPGTLATSVVSSAAATPPSSVASSVVATDELAGGGGGRVTLPPPAPQQEAVMPEVPPAGTKPATPAPPSTPDAQPEALPMPPEMPDASAAAETLMTCDACFGDGRWAPVAPGDGASLRIDQRDDEGTGLPSIAGMLFTLSLGGAWGIARGEAGKRRRRQRVR